jgi:cell division protein FtsB
VIARVVEVPLPEPAPRRSAGTRAGHSAVGRRREQRRRARYAPLGRIAAIVLAFTFVIVAYLALLANVTRLNYELSKSARVRARLVDQSARLEDQIARLESRERLSRLAAKLGMREAGTFAEVALPAPVQPPEPSGIALLSWLK